MSVKNSSHSQSVKNSEGEKKDAKRKIHGVLWDGVIVVGQVMSVTRGATEVKFMIDDSTDVIEAKAYISDWSGVLGKSCAAVQELE